MIIGSGIKGSGIILVILRVFIIERLCICFELESVYPLVLIFMSSLDDDVCK
jgi:hypothetical protein